MKNTEFKKGHKNIISTKLNKRLCKVCNKEIEIERTLIGRKGGGFGRRCYVTSSDGVLFGKGIWFCNDCWKVMLKNIENERRIITTQQGRELGTLAHESNSIQSINRFESQS